MKTSHLDALHLSAGPQEGPAANTPRRDVKQVEAFVGQGEVADDVVVEVFGAGAVGADVVGPPAPAELVAAGGKLAD